MRNLFLAIVATLFISGCAATQVVRQPPPAFSAAEVPAHLQSAEGIYLESAQDLAVLSKTLPRDGVSFAIVKVVKVTRQGRTPMTVVFFHGDIEGTVPPSLPAGLPIVACHAEFLPAAVRARALVAGKGRTIVWPVQQGVFGLGVAPLTEGEAALIRERNQPLFR